MCTRFVYNGKDTITGFNFDIDLSVWDHKIIKEKNRFYIGIKMPDNRYHSFHGVHRNGNAGTLLYVHGNPQGRYVEGNASYTIADLTENYIRGILSFDEVLHILQEQKIVYAPDTTMQAMLSDRYGRVLLIEPGIGYRLEQRRYSLMTNYSVLKPESTRPYIVPGDDRYERAQAQLEKQKETFSVSDAFQILKSVRQKGPWATRVTFVYSAREGKVYYVLNHDFEEISEYSFNS